MDDAISTGNKRRTVRDFSRRNFVLLFLILLMIPTLYLVWYMISIGSGAIVPSSSLPLPQAGAESGNQLAFYTRVLELAWKSTISLVPYSVGQYLLGLQSELDQYFLWASGSLLFGAVLTLVQIFDVFLNPELKTGGKFVWSILMALFAVIGVPIPQLIYWFMYMWTEVVRTASIDTATSTPASA